MPGRQTRSSAARHVGELAEQRVDEDREHDDVGHHELARLHRHVADAGLRRDRLGDDQGEPHDAERVTQADEDRRQRAGQHDPAEQNGARHAVAPRHFDQLRIDRAHAVQRVDVDGKNTPSATRNSFAPSSMPNQTMTSGISARCGMLRTICSVESVRPR